MVLKYFKADITNREQIQNVFSAITKETDTLDVIINVAGIMMMGSLVAEPMEKLERMLKVNVCGMYLINEIFLPLIEKGKGRIINFSSEYGTYTAVPFNGFYTITKRAVETYSDVLRRELNYIGIPVITVRPGAFKTNMEKSIEQAFEAICEKTTHYKKPLTKFKSMLASGTKGAKEPEVLTKVVMKAVTAKKPKRVYKCNHDIKVKMLSKMPVGFGDFVFKLFGK